MKGELTIMMISQNAGARSGEVSGIVLVCHSRRTLQVTAPSSAETITTVIARPY